MLLQGRVIVAVAVVGAAVRQQASSDSSKDAALRILGNIDAMLPQHGSASEVARSFMQQDITPGVETDMNQALTKAIEEISIKVDAPIKSGHARSQKAIDAAFQDLKPDAAAVMKYKTEADEADHAHFECMDEEKGLLLTAEAADDAHQSAQKARTDPCQLQAQRATMDVTVSVKDFKYDCDLNLDGLCEARQQHLQDHGESQYADLVASVQKNRELYQQAKLACDAAHSDVAAKKNAHTAALAAWTTQKSKCARLAANREESICLFGSAMQDKCIVKLPQYEYVVAQVKAKGTDHSHPDRMQEWASAHITKCMMAAAKEGQDLNQALLAGCTKSVDYVNHVGQINYHEEAVAALLSPAQFTCAPSQNISFKGTTWSVPDQKVLVSSDYKVTPFAAQLSLEAGTPPFQFCSGAPAPAPSDPAP